MRKLFIAVAGDIGAGRATAARPSASVFELFDESAIDQYDKLD